MSIKSCMRLLTEAGILKGRMVQSIPPGRGDSAYQGSFRVIERGSSAIEALIERAYAPDSTVPEADPAELGLGGVTKNASYNHLLARVKHVAAGFCDPILLLGETGVGKSELAEQIYQLKKRTHGLKGKFVRRLYPGQKNPSEPLRRLLGRYELDFITVVRRMG